MSIPLMALGMVSCVSLALAALSDYTGMVAQQRVASEVARVEAGRIYDCSDVSECLLPDTETCLTSSGGESYVRVSVVRGWEPRFWTAWSEVVGWYLLETSTLLPPGWVESLPRCRSL